MTLTIDSRTRSRSTDPSTSHNAAEHADSLAADHYLYIHVALRCHGPMTIYQIAERAGLSHVQVARRLPEMQKLGMVEPTGETATGPTGRQCRVWAEYRLQQAVGK